MSLKDFASSHTGRRFFNTFASMVGTLDDLVKELARYNDAQERKKTMPLAVGYRTNFDTLLRAAAAGDLCLLEVKEKATGELRAALCAGFQPEDSTDTQFVPLAIMCSGNPYEDYEPPEGASEPDPTT